MKEIKPTNETGKNPETEQEKEVLPSFFQTLKTSTSKPLPNREVLEYNIMHSAPVKTNTEGYRSMTKVDNRVGGKRSSFSPTFVFRPLTPPYMRFRIRRFLFWVPFEV